MSTAPHTDTVHVTRAIVRALAEAGVRFVVGMPGGNVGGLFAALHGHPTIRVVQVREESIGTTMAEAYGRVTGTPLVVMGQGEWIAGNAGQGLLEALMGSSPVVVLTEMSEGGVLSHHGPYQGGSGEHGCWDVRQALGGMVRRVFVSQAPAQAVQHTQLAVKHACTGSPGPVAVVFHGDALRGKVGPESLPRLYPSQAYLPRRNAAVDGGAIAAAARVLVQAARPVIIAGNGVRVGQACAALATFAATLDLPVATTASGKGVFDETDPRALGVIGTFGQPAANAVVADADCVLAVGTRLGPIDTADENPLLLDPARQTFLQIDIEPLNAGWTFPVDHVLVGDAACQLAALAAALATRPAHWSPAAARVAAARDASDASPAATDDTFPLAPQRLVHALQARLPADTLITSDAGENRLFMLHWFRSRRPGGYLMPAAGGGMGYAVPAALGARLADPTRPIVAVCGDGGFAMSIHALMTSVQEKLPIGVVVFNNNALGWVEHGMGEKAVASRFDDFDHAAIARSLGARGLRVRNVAELERALDELANSRETTVIDVPTSLATSFKAIVQPLAAKRWKAGD